MKSQQGAALVIVMVLLTAMLMLGVSMMQSSLIDERLAGNYRAAVQAQMSAESEAAERMFVVADESGLDCQDAMVLDASGREDWEAGFYHSDTHSGSRYTPCVLTDELGSFVFVIEGYVGDSKRPEASHFMLAGSLAGQNTGADPSEIQAITEFIDYIQSLLGSDDVIASCDAGTIMASGSSIAFCNGDYVGQIDSGMENILLVTTGSITTGVGGQGQPSTFSTSLVALGDIVVSGMGNDVLEGIVWSGGDITFNGNANVIGEVISIAENITVNGRERLEAGEAIADLLEESGLSPADDYIWRQF
ncbi:PilX N-terminal domain-containing pilus assembly protein [Vreelandella rituensis]|uniref:Type 4 fimbrial biogenesis protein PilX N-terminal domain-containing protein n=1 Tax=Vreelandella rituensis TaxID=2282306 RepID=A0A368U9X3_9GAMM|nr:PilX N-terminal domain-containing pilus assembly protein [Halomonas rituensis]RCV93754.1 hypothetical protein DU506_00955 [Halomonas rituensis]